MIAVLGEVMVGGNVTTYNGFLKIRKKGTAQAAAQQESPKTNEGLIYAEGYGKNGAQALARRRGRRFPLK